MGKRQTRKRSPRCRMPSVEEPGKTCGYRIPCPYHGLGSVCGADEDPCKEMENHFATEDRREARKDRR
jgi:hypothetical protein